MRLDQIKPAICPPVEVFKPCLDEGRRANEITLRARYLTYRQATDQ